MYLYGVKLLYLTESLLIEFIKLHLDSENIICNKKLPGCSINCRPDYVNLDSNIIVEFDGYKHYNDAKTILRDRIKDKEFKNLGFKIIRWPYFIQLSSSSIKYYFNLDLNYHQTYPHGFIDSKALLPADFNSLGVSRFYSELEDLPEDIKFEILDSLFILSTKLDSDLIFP